MDKNGNLYPSAFIPFCDLGGNISIMGTLLKGLNIPVCNSFREKFHNNQLCYEVDVNQFKNKVDSKQIVRLGLTFMVDTNNNRQIYQNHNKIVSESFSNIGEKDKFV